MNAPHITTPSPASMSAGGLIAFFWLTASIKFGTPVVGPWWAICIGIGGPGFLYSCWKATEYTLDRKRGLGEVNPQWTKASLSSTRSIATSALWLIFSLGLFALPDRSTIAGYIASAVGGGFILMSLPAGLRWYLIWRYETEEERRRQPVMPPAPGQHVPTPKVVQVPSIR